MRSGDDLEFDWDSLCIPKEIFNLLDAEFLDKFRVELEKIFKTPMTFESIIYFEGTAGWSEAINACCLGKYLAIKQFYDSIKNWWESDFFDNLMSSMIEVRGLIEKYGRNNKIDRVYGKKIWIIKKYLSKKCIQKIISHLLYYNKQVPQMIQPNELTKEGIMCHLMLETMILKKIFPVTDALKAVFIKKEEMHNSLHYSQREILEYSIISEIIKRAVKYGFVK